MHTTAVKAGGRPLRTLVSLPEDDAGDVAALWPYKQWEHQAAQTVPAGTAAPEWLRDVMVTRVAVELRVDLLVTCSRPILDSALQWIAEANPMTAEQALAAVGLYLRGRRKYPMLGPNLFTFGEHQLLWSSARAQLPSGWRWGSALVAHSTGVAPCVVMPCCRSPAAVAQADSEVGCAGGGVERKPNPRGQPGPG